MGQKGKGTLSWENSIEKKGGEKTIIRSKGGEGEKVATTRGEQTFPVQREGRKMYMGEKKTSRQRKTTTFL